MAQSVRLIAPNRTRTCNHPVRSRVLYPLSHRCRLKNSKDNAFLRKNKLKKLFFKENLLGFIYYFAMFKIMTEERIEGIVLRSQDYKESHRIITLFTPRGLIDL